MRATEVLESERIRWYKNNSYRDVALSMYVHRCWERCVEWVRSHYVGW